MGLDVRIAELTQGLRLKDKETFSSLFFSELPIIQILLLKKQTAFKIDFPLFYAKLDL